jgi:hypothetical protein
LQALRTAVEQERLKKALLEAGVDTMRAQVAHSGVASSMRESERAQRIVEIIRRVRHTVPEGDRDLLEDLLRERLALLDDLDRWKPIATAVCQEINEARAHWDISLRRDRQRISQERAAQADAARAARAAQDAELQAKSATTAQLAANAQRRAQAIAETIAVEIAAQGAPDWIVLDAQQAAWRALVELDVVKLYDDNVAFYHARRAGQWAAATAAWGAWT